MRTQREKQENEAVARIHPGDIPGASESLSGQHPEKIGSVLHVANRGGFECLFKVLFMQPDIQASIFSVKWEIRLLAKSKKDSVGAEEWREGVK